MGFFGTVALVIVLLGILWFFIEIAKMLVDIRTFLIAIDRRLRQGAVSMPPDKERI